MDEGMSIEGLLDRVREVGVKFVLTLDGTDFGYDDEAHPLSVGTQRWIAEAHDEILACLRAEHELGEATRRIVADPRGSLPDRATSPWDDIEPT